MSHRHDHANTYSEDLRPAVNPHASRIYTPTSSASSSRTRESSTNIRKPGSYQASSSQLQNEDSDEEMGDRRPHLHRPTDGRSAQPLLRDERESGRGRSGYSEDGIAPVQRPVFSRRQSMRSRSPDTQAKMATKKKYTYAAFFLGLSLISFTIQTETAVYIQHELGWNKAYCML
jgi:hypothetical protein